MKFRTHIYLEDDTEVSVTVSYKYYPPSRGARDSLGGVRGAGPPLEPDDPPEICVLSIEDDKGTEYSLEDYPHVEDLCWEHLNSNSDL